MVTKYDAVYLSLLAALGLACAARPGASEGGSGGESGDSMSAGSGESSSESASGSMGDGDGDTTTGDGDGDTTASTRGDGDGDTTTGDGDGEGTTGLDPFECDDPVVILQAGTELPSGFVECDNGFIHREQAVECVTPQAADDPLCEPDGFGCTSAADCVEQPHGSCQANGFLGDCQCNYGCVSDADCGPGMACVCAGVVSPITQCMPTNCATDADCSEGLCGLSRYEDICETSYSLACTTPQDGCHTDADCEIEPCDPMNPDWGQAQYHCSAAFGPGYQCEAPGWCLGDCGRPFIVDAQLRAASTCARADWRAELRPSSLGLEQLPPATKAELARYWSEVGRFEHASIASFARAAAQLLELGAPPQLLRDTHAAMRDEIEHARFAFALASAYAGAPLGPGPLPVHDALAPGSDPQAILAALIDEACVGETLSALELLGAAQRARAPELAARLEPIAADELRHAQLGWRTLRWLLERHPELRSFALARLQQALTRAPQPSEGPCELDGDAELRAHGVLDPALRAQLRGEAIDAVLRPCLEALRAASPGSSPARAACG